MAEPEILFEQRGAAGIVTLNRPQALNALNLKMVQAMSLQLAAWAAEPAVTRVVLRAVGERAFCAGGDLREIYDLHKAGRAEEGLGFWRAEYPMDVLIQRYTKPYVALIDGLVMGGGVGVSMHGAFRVAGDRFRFAMPEVGIGFFPDAGGTYLLPRLPGKAGTYLALTGNRVDAGDAIALGLATERVPSAAFPALTDALAGGLDVRGTIAAFSVASEPPKLGFHQAVIDRVFSADTVEEILVRLDQETGGIGDDAIFARDTAATMRGKAPLSLKIALEQMKRGLSLDFANAMRTEFRIVARVVQGHDFFEGIRAVVVDKDNAPRWNPATLDAVSEAMVARHFAPLPREQELKL
jgi:enoyl-CoA hydratase/carnithine racemase